MSPSLHHVASHLGPPLREWLRLRVAEHTRDRRQVWAEIQQEKAALQLALQQVDQRLEQELQRLDRSPLTAHSTVHAAHRAHPGVQAIFARYGLPRCLDCAVGRDERLEEAAFDEGMPLPALLKELNTLLLSPR